MKLFVLLAAVISATVAEYAHHYPIHIPVIGPKGVPLEPPEVVHARQAHLSHVAAHHGHGGAYYGGYAAAPGPAYYGGHHGASIHIPVIGPHGVPLDTPEVAAAKAHHFAAHAKAAAHAGPAYYGEHYRKRRSIYGGHFLNQHVPVIGHDGVPLDTPEVAAAKAAHFAEHAKARTGYGGYPSHQLASSHIAVGGYGGYHGPYPELDHDGRPIETPEVQALKHKHFAAHAEAKSRIGAIGAFSGYGGHYDDGSSHYGGGSGFIGGPYGGESRHVAAYHIPVIDHNGVPQETPEVQAAKKYHLAALAEAQARSGGSHY